MNHMIMAELRALPKVELHVHLDGSLRDDLIWATARRRRIALPDDVHCAGDLAPYTTVKPGCSSLTEFLQTFLFYTPIIKGDRIALRQMALDACQDLKHNNVIYAELRYAPHLLADDGLSVTEVVEIISAALREGSSKFAIKCNSILCAMRHFPNWTKQVVDLANRFRNSGVVGIDIAGDERHSCVPHSAEFTRAKALGIRITAHASEAGPAEEILNVVKLLHAERIGHGYHCIEDSAVYDFVKKESIHLECCLTSSRQTCAVTCALADHPVLRFSQENVEFSLSTDDPSVCGTTLNREYQIAACEVGLSFKAICATLLCAVRASFLPEDEKNALFQVVSHHIERATHRLSALKQTVA